MESLLSPGELDGIQKLVRETESLPGDIAEVGVYQGSSAKRILEATKKTVWLFDTFEGIPYEQNSFNIGQYACNMDAVYYNLKEHDHFKLVKGIFPNTASVCLADKFSFVHLDCDTDKSIKESLEWFWPRMTKGGWVVIHDGRDSVFSIIKKITGLNTAGYQCLIQKP